MLDCNRVVPCSTRLYKKLPRALATGSGHWQLLIQPCRAGQNAVIVQNTWASWLSTMYRGRSHNKSMKSGKSIFLVNLIENIEKNTNIKDLGKKIKLIFCYNDTDSLNRMRNVSLRYGNELFRRGTFSAK